MAESFATGDRVRLTQAFVDGLPPVTREGCNWRRRVYTVTGMRTWNGRILLELTRKGAAWKHFADNMEKA